MTFADPWFLLLTLPLLGALPLLRRGEKGASGVLFPHGRVLRDLPPSFRVKAAGLLPLLRSAGLLLLVLALARPQSVGKDRTLPRKGIDIMLALDLSTSMKAKDLDSGVGGEDRLRIAQRVLREFITRREGDRIGMIVFAAHPYLLAPLTLDHQWLRENLTRVTTDSIEDGTALGDALLAALARLTDNGVRTDHREKIVILLTDGRNNAGSISPAVAAASARALGIKVHTVGVGSRGRALFPLTDPFGATVYRQLPVDMDEPTLREIARNTGGDYYQATDAATLQKVCQRIDTLEKRPLETREHLPRRELFPLFLLPALAFLLAEITLTCTLLRRSP